MTDEPAVFDGRLLVVAFEGWNDAGDAASNAVRTLQDELEVFALAELDTESYYDHGLVRPTAAFDESGRRNIIWPTTTFYAPLAPESDISDTANLGEDADIRVTASNGDNIYLLLGAEPSRNWQSFTAEIVDLALAADISGIVLLGALLADAPHTRPIAVFASSENERVRSQLSVERSTYEGPVGILSVLADAAERAGIPTVSLWASVPHYVHHAPSPKATLALIDRLEEVIDIVIPRGQLVEQSAEWESNIDRVAAEDDDMTSYIASLEQARDAVDSPAASGEAIAQEFERFLRGKEDRSDPSGPSAPGTQPPPA